VAQLARNIIPMINTNIFFISLPPFGYSGLFRHVAIVKSVSRISLVRFMDVSAFPERDEFVFRVTSG